MPQTLSDACRADLGPDAEQVHAIWLHTSGNLTFTTYNQPPWKHTFAVKRSVCAARKLTRPIPAPGMESGIGSG